MLRSILFRSIGRRSVQQIFMKFTTWSNVSSKHILLTATAATPNTDKSVSSAVEKFVKFVRRRNSNNCKFSQWGRDIVIVNSTPDKSTFRLVDEWGDLTAMLTTQMSPRNVDTFQNLKDLDIYKIYGLSSNKVNLSDKYVEDDFIGLVQQFNLYMSKDFIELVYMGFRIRWNSPVEQRVNIIISRMVEARMVHLKPGT